MGVKVLNREAYQDYTLDRQGVRLCMEIPLERQEYERVTKMLESGDLRGAMEALESELTDSEAKAMIKAMTPKSAETGEGGSRSDKK